MMKRRKWFDSRSLSVTIFYVKLVCLFKLKSFSFPSAPIMAMAALDSILDVPSTFKTEKGENIIPDKDLLDKGLQRVNRFNLILSPPSTCV